MNGFGYVVGTLGAVVGMGIAFIAGATLVIASNEKEKSEKKLEDNKMRDRMAAKYADNKEEWDRISDEVYYELIKNEETE